MKQLGCLIVCLVSIYLPLVNAEQSSELIIMTDNAPPHVIEQKNVGIDIDLTLAVLNSMGMSARIEYAPLSRGKKLVESKIADLFVPTFFQQDADGIFVSNAIIEYRPTLFSLAPSVGNISDFSQIKDKKVATFQGAIGYFGKDFEQMSKVNYYREVHDMSMLPRMLVNKEVDIVFLDYYIFYYFLKEEGFNTERNKISINEHLLNNISAHVGFNNQQLRDRFNQALKELTPEEKSKIINQFIH